MLQEIKAIEPQLKQILYGCVEHVQATKAALYLSASQDLNSKTFELVTSYQYNAGERKVVGANDDLVDRLVVKRSGFYVNGFTSDNRLAEMMFRQGTDRMLATPLFSRGRLVGFIDMRDKAGKKLFENGDVEAAKRIADQMLGVLSANKLFGVGPVALVEEPEIRPVTASGKAIPLPNVMPQPAPAPGPREPGQVISAEAMAAIEAARQHLSRRQLQHKTGRRSVAEGDIEVLRLLLPAALAIPGAVVACLSTMGQINNPQLASAIGHVADEVLDLVEAHLQALLRRANEPHLTRRPQVSYPVGVQALPIGAPAITAVVSAPVNPASVVGLVLTVAFERTPEPQAQHSLTTFLQQIGPTIESALAASVGGADRQVIAERLLEPDFQKFPDLAGHCREVSLLAQRFARALGLPATQVETVRLAALVHDVGLRVIDYERMHKGNLTPEEMRALAEHPIVGAALVESLLGPEVAQAVLRHHERIDGKGYPSRLAGQQIPLASRIIQIADAWVAMTAHTSYQAPISRDKAVSRLRDGAGSQFDPALVEKFLAHLPTMLA